MFLLRWRIFSVKLSLLPSFQRITWHGVVSAFREGIAPYETEKELIQCRRIFPHSLTASMAYCEQEGSKAAGGRGFQRGEVLTVQLHRRQSSFPDGVLRVKKSA